MMSSHSRWRVEMLRKPVTPRCAGVVEHFVLALDEALVIEVAMAIDQPHAAASSLPAARAAGTAASAAAIGAPPSPGVDRARAAFGTIAGMIGAIASASRATASNQRAEHRRHSCGIGLAQRPRRLRIDISVAGEDRPHPGFDRRPRKQALERLGNLLRPPADHSSNSTSSVRFALAPEERHPSS